MSAIEPRPTPVIETARLRLRPIEARDADALHVPLSDRDLMTWWSSGPHASIDETRAYIDPSKANPGWRWWAITLKGGEDTALGWVCTGEKRHKGVSEIGYILTREHWGGGIAREAVSAVIDQVFAEGQRRVYADTDPDNLPSRALLEKLGFKLEGYLRAEWETHIGVRDTTLYGLLPEEWAATSR